MVIEAPRLDTGGEGEVARGFETLVMRSLRREPNERYRSADEMLADLLLLGQGAAPRTEPHTAPPLARSIDIDLLSLSPERSIALGTSSLSILWEATPSLRRWPRATATVALVAALAMGALLERQSATPVAHVAELQSCPV